MLPVDVTLNLLEEITIDTETINTGDVLLELEKEADVDVEMTSVVPVIIDLDSMTASAPDTSGRYGRTQLIVFFVKSVLGKKKTFSQVSLPVNMNRQVNGTVTINPGTRNLVNRQTVFGKAVSAKKFTFAQVALNIIDTIQVIGTNTVGTIRFYGSGIYGSGIYEGITGYGAGIYGDGIYPGEAISRTITFGSVISGFVPVKQTAVAEISLAPHGAPELGTNHAIKVRARTLTGSTGVLKAALYEGAVNRSGDLSTTPLTNTLTDYTLYIPEANVNNITDYSNLSIRFWGYDSAGNALVFQVSRIYLELPIVTGSTKFGVIARPITFTKAVSGAITNKKTQTAEISLAAHGTPVQRTNHTIKIRARTVLEGTNAVLKAALYEGLNNRSGDLITSPLTTTLADYNLIIPDYLTETIIDYSNLSIKLWGYSLTTGSVIFEVARIYLELPVSSGIGSTKYGSLTMPITFVKAVSGVKSSPGIQYGSVARVTTFTKAVSGKATIKAVVARTTTFTKDVSGKATLKGVVARAITFTKSVAGVIVTGKSTTVAEISLASHGTPSVRTNHSIKVRARTTSGSTGVLKAELYEGSTVRSGATPLETSVLTNSLADYTLAIPDAAVAAITSYSNLSIKFWGHDPAGNPLVFEVSRIYLELPVPAGTTLYGIVDRPTTFTKDVSGTATIKGVVARPITFTKDVAGVIVAGGYGSSGYGQSSGGYGN